MNLAAALDDQDKIDPEMQHALNEMAEGRHGDEIVDAEILPAVAPTLSVAAVKPSFEQYFKKAELMVLSASKMEVKDEESNRIAVTLGGEAKKIAKMIDAQCKEVTQEAADFVDGVKGLCKIITEKLVANPKKTNSSCIEITLKNKITAYQSKVELERRKQEEAARKAAAELQAKLDAEAAEANRKAREEAEQIAEAEAKKRKASEAEIAAAKKAAAEEAAKHEIQAPQVPDLIIPKQEAVTRTETGTSSYQVKSWKCTIIDAPLVPRQFCEPSQKFLNDAVKQGVREIPGCKIEEVSETRFRT
jgi:hypothetical protein